MGVNYTPAEGGAPNLIGYTGVSQLMDGAGVRHTLDVTIAEDGLSVELEASASATLNWAAGSASLDVKFSQGTVTMTDTFTFPIIPQITVI